MSQAKALVSVVIPTYRRASELRRCIASVRSGAESLHKPVEIVVSACGYGPADLINIQRDGTKLVASEERLPLGVTRNRGASIATGDLLLFLDDDNVIDSGCIVALAERLMHERALAMVGPLMYYGNEPNRLWCAGIRRSRLLGRTSKVTRIPDPPPQLLPSLDFPNCFMVRRSDFMAVGRFDEKLLPVFFSESDLATRLRKAGLGGAACVTSARVWHFIGPGLTRYLSLHDPELAYQAARARAIFAARHGDLFTWLGYLLVGQFLFTAFYLGPGLGGFAWSRRPQMIKAYLQGAVDGLFAGMKLRSEVHKGTEATVVE